MSRRALLGTAGAAGAVLIAGSLLSKSDVRAFGDGRVIVVDDIADLKAFPSEI